MGSIFEPLNIFKQKLSTMKTLSFFRLFALLSFVALVISCQKESLLQTGSSVDYLMASNENLKANKPREHKILGAYNQGSYQFIPGPGWIAPNPVPAWYPGEAEGQLNLLGKSTGLVNIYLTMGTGGLIGTPAPVNLFFAARLSELGITVPDAVTVIMFDKQGNSIWANGGTAIPVTPVSATRVLFEVNAQVIGGTGKFTNATGHFEGTGYFNPEDTDDVGLEMQNGVIVY
jgi:hypothetical protein